MTVQRTKRPTTCLTCEDDIGVGEAVCFEHGVGAWHTDCPPPRNLRLYQRERDRGPRRQKRHDFRIDDE